ncbi:metallo-beta-lactamase family protein [Plectosphaerella plurivora]|uniref:Metallo-beta-lactamase family protein n=1 Tax=Plectosphaerella plurivora TaxID=936078 RepID=A0A9P8V743_9PEZI|nr:metallo-beta-lactamase family protein [Plectosphaerella plurivora]
MLGKYAASVLVCASTIRAACTPGLRAEHFINSAPSLDMVSTLVIGSEAAVIFDLPLAIPQAVALADWVKNTTDKPVIAAFTTHFHPDHYLSGAAFLDRFPDANFYANAQTASLIKNDAAERISIWKSILGDDAIVDVAAVPVPFNFTFFTLPGDESSPIHLISPLVADTIDKMIFWIPSISTLIAGDAVYGRGLHLWLADMLSPALTQAWLSTLEFIESLSPKKVIPGHATSLESFSDGADIEHTRRYIEVFQEQVEAKGKDALTPAEISEIFDSQFPGLLASSTSALLLNVTSEEFGRGGTRLARTFDLASFNDTQQLAGWNLK